jgi:hypothetical protein
MRKGQIFERYVCVIVGLLIATVGALNKSEIALVVGVLVFTAGVFPARA